MEIGATQSMILGLVMPPIIDLVNTKIHHSRVRFVVSLLICFFVALGLETFNILTSGQNFDWSEVFTTLTVVFSTAQVVYKTIWNTSSARTSLMNLVS